MRKSVVSIAKGTDVAGLVADVLAPLGGVSKLIKPNSTVVIKPNAGHPHPPETSVNTSPALVTAVIREIRKARPKEIIVAEAGAVGCDTLANLEVSGIGKAAEEGGADKIIDIKRHKDLIKVPIRDARSALKSVLLPRFLIEAEHIVNLPIFKSHVSMMFTCAMKNLKGVVQDKVHREMHQTALAEAMIDLWSVVKADLNIADMIRPAEGFGPHATMPVEFDCLVAGRDPVSVDATICRMVGLDVGRVPYFESARERGLGNYAEELIEVRGKTIQEVFKQLWLPYVKGLDAWPEYDIHTENACSSCQGLLAYTMEMLKVIGEYDKHAGTSIIIGPKKSLPEGAKRGKDLILIGDCLKKHRREGLFAPGCPPMEPPALFAIVDRKIYEGSTLRGRHGPIIEALYDYQKRLKAQAAESDRDNRGGA
jgi:uncharacterized protein (DUF362 family)